MNSIFSEIYGTYFRIASKLLEQPETDEKTVRDIVSREGFRDSLLFLPQKLIPCGEDWGLFRKKSDGRMDRITRYAPVRTMTLLQKRWLKAKLSDPRIKLFMDDDALSALEGRLKDVKPLWTGGAIRCFDVFADCDSYTDWRYIRNFRTVLEAVKKHSIVEISFVSGHGRRLWGKFVLLKIEYSAKNDKFRVYCFMLRRDGKARSGIVNIGRITRIMDTGEVYGRKVDMDRFFAERRCGEPAVVRVTNERNGWKRFMMEFAELEKHTVHDTEKDEYTVKMWYDKYDETELLIRLLSFGPVIEILGSEKLRKMAAERIRKQYELTNK